LIGILFALSVYMAKNKFLSFLKFLSVSSLSCSTALAQNANYEFYKQQQSYLSQNRTNQEKLSPFQNPNLFKNSDEVEKFISSVSSERYIYKYDSTKNEVLVYDQSKKNDLVSILPMSTREDILSYRPSKFKERLKTLSRDMYLAGKGGVRHTAVNLPMEVSIFYMAIGSVSAFNLFSNAGQNPAALKLFNDQQTSAVGMTSLFMFLASQNATSNMAQLFIKNPKWHIMLPYLSMTVGTMVQNYTSSLMTDPNIKACVNEWFGPLTKVEGASENPCDKAYEYFTLQKPWEFAPGLTSMIVSTIAASTVQYSASTAALAVEKQITSQVIKNEIRRDIAKVALLRFAGFINPGAVPYLAVSGAWLYLTKASNLAFFAALDHKIVHGITFAVKNLQESVSLPFIDTLKKTSDNLTNHLINQQKNNWSVKRNSDSCKKFKNGDCTGLYEDLVKLQDQMKIWRMANIAEVTETHHSWQTYLGDLLARYQASKEFYERFIAEAIKYKNEPNKENYLNRKYPFWGVSTSKTKYYDETYFTDPHLPESEQMLRTITVKDQVLKIFEARKQHAQRLIGEDLEFYNKIQDFFKNNYGSTENEKIKLGLGLDLVTKWLKQEKVKGRNYYADFLSIQDLISKLGSPAPQLEPGVGFIYAIGRSPKLNELYKNIDVSQDNSITRTRQFTSFSEVTFTNMICGPDLDKNELLIGETWGFQAKFTPPRITNLIDVVKNGDRFCSTRFPLPFFKSENSLPFVGPFTLNQNQKEALYQSPFEFLKYNLKLDLYNKNFESWWTEKTDRQLNTAFNSFQDKYISNIALLIKKLNQKENSSWNRSDTLANGTMINIFQELRMYLLVLGEILKSSAQNSNTNIASLVDENESLRIGRIPLTPAERQVNIPEVLKYQSRGSFLDFSNILDTFKNAEQKTPRNIVFKFQTQMEKHFAELNGLLQKVKVIEDGQQTKIIGNLDNNEFDVVIEKIENLSVNISEIYGVGSKRNSLDNGFPSFFNSEKLTVSTPMLSSVDDNTKLIVVKSLEFIQSLAYEVKTYGMIVNAVNWNSLNNLKETSDQSAKRKEKVDSIIKNMKTTNKVGG
jgi:hypothetical protein